MINERIRQLVQRVREEADRQFNVRELSVRPEFGVAGIEFLPLLRSGSAAIVTDTGVSLFIEAKGWGIDSSERLPTPVDDSGDLEWAVQTLSCLANYGLFKLRRPRWLPVFSEWLIPSSAEELAAIVSRPGLIARSWTPW